MQLSPVFCRLALLLGLALTALPVQAQMFTTANGYVDGTLGGQLPYWTGTATTSQWAGTNPNYQVNTATGTVAVTTTATSSQSMYWNSDRSWTTLRTVGYTVSSTTDFSFTQSASGQTGINGFWSTGLSDNGNFQLYGNVRFYGANNLVLSLGQISSIGGIVSLVENPVSISTSGIGLNAGSGDYTTDRLRMTTSLTLGADQNSWVMSATLFNVTTGLVVATTSGSFATNAEEYNKVYNGNYAWYAKDYIQAIDQAGLDALTVYNVTKAAITVPEPGSVALLGLGLLAVGGLRLRRKQS